MSKSCKILLLVLLLSCEASKESARQFLLRPSPPGDANATNGSRVALEEDTRLLEETVTLNATLAEIPIAEGDDDEDVFVEDEEDEEVPEEEEEEEEEKEDVAAVPEEEEDERREAEPPLAETEDDDDDDETPAAEETSEEEDMFFLSTTDEEEEDEEAATSMVGPAPSDDGLEEEEISAPVEEEEEISAPVLMEEDFSSWRSEPVVAEEAPTETTADSTEKKNATTLPNEKWVLRRSVARGELDPARDVEKVTEDMAETPPEGAALVRTELLSVDAFARTKVRAAREGHALPATGVGVVLQSRVKGLRPGARVLANLGAQRYAHVSFGGDTLGDDGAATTSSPSVREESVPSRLAKNLNPRLALGACGASTGLAAYVGVHRVAKVRRSKDVVVVTAAHTAIGAVAARLLKRAGVALCVGVAPGKDLCARLVDEQIVDVAVDALGDDFAARLDDVLKSEVDLVFDCGGRGLDLVLLDRLATGARVVLCAPSIREDDDDEHRDLVGAYDDLAEKGVSLLGFRADDAGPSAVASMVYLHLAGALAGCDGHVETDFDRFPTALAALVNTAFGDDDTSPNDAARTFARTRLGQVLVDLRPPPKASGKGDEDDAAKEEGEKTAASSSDDDGSSDAAAEDASSSSSSS